METWFHTKYGCEPAINSVSGDTRKSPWEEGTDYVTSDACPKVFSGRFKVSNNNRSSPLFRPEVSEC